MNLKFRSSATDPSLRGLEFGQRHAQQILSSVRRYQALFERVASRSVDVKRMGAQALARVAAFAPPLHAEMLGMAEGARIDPELIGAINARTEVLASLRTAIPGECSTVVHIDPYKASPVSVQTWDWYSEFADQWLVWEIPHSDGGVTTTVTEFGIVGKIGVNNRKLGLHFNILHHRRDGGEMGVPVHVLSRWVLDRARDINHALQIFDSAQVSASSSLTLVTAVDQASSAVSVEIYPGGFGLVFPSADGLLVHTNHFLSAPACEGDTEPRAFPDTLVRHDLLVRRLRLERNPTAEKVLAAMNSHLGTIGAVCCHPDETRPAEGQYSTLACVVLDVAGGKLQALKGGPCLHERWRSAAA